MLDVHRLATTHRTDVVTFQAVRNCVSLSIFLVLVKLAQYTICKVFVINVNEELKNDLYITLY